MSFLLPIFLLLVGFFANPAYCENAVSSMRFELIHRDGPELLGAAITLENRLQHFRELARRDTFRKKMMSEMIGRRRRATELSGDDNSFAMPMSSGAYARTGQYFVRFQVGTPAEKFLLVADTGSDLTWMNCQYRCQNCTGSGGSGRRIFHADRSSSFSPIPCSSTTCPRLTFSLVECPTPESPCAYDYRYADGSFTKGIFATESTTVTLSSGERVKLKSVVIGCSSSFDGGSFRAADGVLGLAWSNHSFAVKAAERAGGKFSYCLVDHLSPKNASGYLSFGGATSASACKSSMQHTRLFVDPVLNTFYAVQVTGISVGGAPLPIPPVVWDASRQGGVILDSGSSLTMLAEPAYRAVMSALSGPLMAFPKIESKPFDFCFNVTGGGYREELVPRLAFQLDGAARFEPPVKSYVIDVADGMKCIGILSAPWPTSSTIGNILQQNFVWEFDLHKGWLGFEPSTCGP